MAIQTISIRGAKEHNLKNIDIDIPRDKLVVITGMSGSGKSTLAFDTIYAEGQRKYVESLSAYARQFLDQLQKPEIESIEGLPPTIAIEQRSASHNPRSTVATTTEIYDYMRLLCARVGKPRCWHVDETGKACGHVIERQSASQIVDNIMKLPEGAKLMLLAPLVRGKKGQHEDVFTAMTRQGFVRARVNGEVVDLKSNAKTPGPKLGRYEAHDIEAVVDRVVVKHNDTDVRNRVADSVELSLKLAEGLVIVSVSDESVGVKPAAGQPQVMAVSQATTLKEKATGWTDTLYSEKYACPYHPESSLEELEPRLFSFNSPHGACPTCGGLGTVMEFDEDLVVPDQSLSLTNGAVDAWRHHGVRMNIYYAQILKRFCRDFAVDPASPFSTLGKGIQKILLHGTQPKDEKKYGYSFEGVIPNLQRRFQGTDSEYVKQKLHEYLSEAHCETCHGARLRKEALHVFIKSAHQAEAIVETGKPKHDRSWGVNIHEVVSMTIERAHRFFEGLELTQEQEHIAAPVIKEIKARLGFLLSVGLGYLSLGRATSTLSGGESQRIRLATQVGSGLVGCCYVLDEPTIGLHQRDNDRLIATLRHLTNIGNTVIVVEHDEDTIRTADYLIDIGPGPGRHGGNVVAQGTVQEVIDNPKSLTGKYLSGALTIDLPKKRRTLDHVHPLTVVGAKENNLKSVDVKIPLGGIVCVTGVSGSGKSTLVNQVLLRAVKKHVLGSKDKPGEHEKVLNMNKIDRIIEVDQSPIGRTPRSNPATYTGVFDDIRNLYTHTKEAKIRGYKPGRFSFNVKGGRCEACEGQGIKKIEMHFLPDVFVQCEVCKGRRYNRETLEVQYKSKNIAQVLDMTVEESIGFFENYPEIHRIVTALADVGLGYLQLGQSSTTLSGGEAQRVKLATELGKRPTGHTLYILDEPTTGLHFADISRLLSVLHRLADQGNTVVVIEHNLDVIKCADWIVDLGPEGGERGGTLIAQGTPEEVVKVAGSYTGKYLAKYV